MTNIAELLKDCPTGTKLYSPLFGEVKFAEVMDTDFVPIRVMKRSYGLRFDKYGRYMGNEYPDSECILFPSKEIRTWEGWKLPKPHYDIKNFKPFDKVLVRDADDGKWVAAFYNHYMYEEKDYPYQFATIGTDVYGQCIPFDGNEHLLGTTDMCDERFINW